MRFPDNRRSRPFMRIRPWPLCLIAAVMAWLTAAPGRDIATPIALQAAQTTTQRAPSQTPSDRVVALPNKPDSLKFGVLGDFGTGSRQQYELAAQMVNLYSRFKYTMVVLVGDNLYGSERPQDFKSKFET